MKKISYSVVKIVTQEVMHTCNDEKDVYIMFSQFLRYRYVKKSAFVRSMRRLCNYNGTATYAFYCDNGLKYVFTVED